MQKETAWEKYNRERKEKKKVKRLSLKEQEKDNKKTQFERPKEKWVKTGEASEAELKLLLGNENEKEFVPETSDSWFSKLGKGAFALDPTDRSFSKAGDAFI